MPKTNKTNTSKIPRPTKKRKRPSSLKLRNFKYYLVQSFKSLMRNKFMFFSSIITVAACMTMVIASFAGTSNVNLFLNHLETSVGITVHINDDLNETQRSLLQEEIGGLENVAITRMVSPDEALASLAAQFGDTEGIFEMALGGEENPLSYTIVVDLFNVRQQRQTIEQMEQFFGIDLIRASAEATDMLITANNLMAVTGFAIISILAILSVVIITNTIRLTVNSRRNEIVIMKYVGATDWFIKWPFIIEGMLIGVIGGIIPLIAMWFAYDSLAYGIQNSDLFYIILGELPFRTTSEIFPIVAPFVVILGLAIGTLGSMTSMRKHLNV